MNAATAYAPVSTADAAESPFRRAPREEAAQAKAPEIHVYGNGVVCATDTRGHASPRNRTPAEIVLDATSGFIPLWAANTTLRWRFQERSLNAFANPAAAKAEIEAMLGEALLAWGDAAPVKFARRQEAWDFEIVTLDADDCDANGCVLAAAFFPDGGRHELVIYPKMFTQSRSEQVETLIHEIGHIFGLRHFFAQISEERWPSVVFGQHEPFTIMNYGNRSMLTDADKSDLQRLYAAAWRGELTSINGTPVKLVKPFSAGRGHADAVMALAAARA